MSSSPEAPAADQHMATTAQNADPANRQFITTTQQPNGTVAQGPGPLASKRPRKSKKNKQKAQEKNKEQIPGKKGKLAKRMEPSTNLTKEYSNAGGNKASGKSTG